jgi:hypothetical protein
VNKFNLENCTNVKLNLNSFSSLRLISSKFVTLKRHTPDKFDLFLEDNFLTGRAISMTLCMKISVTIVLVLRCYNNLVVLDWMNMIAVKLGLHKERHKKCQERDI